MARKKADDNQAEPKDGDSTDEVEHASNVRADRGSIAIGSVSIGGDLSGSFTIGYTADQVSLLLTQITSKFQPKPFDGRCPYKGLEVFEEQDADLFFGRERLVEDLVSRVKESRTIFITGPSGSGKSSLVRAGLIHTLKQGAIKNLYSEHWLYEMMRPGREPLEALALVFSRLKSPELANYFRIHAHEINVLNECAESALSGRADQRFLLFVDQFEEVFTQINKEEERVAFINMLAHAATIENGHVIVLFAMRSEFVSNCATYPAINELLSQQFRQIGAMQPEELVSAIALPAKQVGLPIEDELIARIINDMKGEPGALPLMQFALKDLFDSQQEKGEVITLTLEDYLRHGGIQKSLEHHADKSFAQLSESEQQFARSIFSGLIEIGRGTVDTRRTALFPELVPANAKAEDIESVVQKLADARLIITDEQAGEDTVTISHEKLIDAWPWLKRLVNENRDVIALQNEIASDAKEWDDHKRDPSYLYTGARLANAREQLDAKKLVLSGPANDFVQAGLLKQQYDQRMRILSIAGVVGLIIAGILLFSYISITSSNNLAKQSQNSENTQVAIASTSQANEMAAQTNANIALARQLAAQAQSIMATKNSKQMLAILLAIQSMKMFPSAEASQVLQNNSLVYPMTLMTHEKAVNSVAFSPNGKYVVSGSWDNTARVWDVATGKEIARMTHAGNVTSVAFSPDSKYVVSGGGDTAYVWDATTGKEIASMTHGGGVTSVAFSPDSKYVVSGGGNTARVWEATTGKEIASMTSESDVSILAFSPNGKYVVSGSWFQTSHVWEVVTGKEVAELSLHGGVTSVAFSPDGRYVVSGGLDSARVWEAATGKEIAHITHDNNVSSFRLVDSVAFSPDGKYVVSGSGWDTTAYVWEAITGEEIARMTHDEGVTSVAFSLDGKYVVTGSLDHTARVWETVTGKEVASMAYDADVNSVAFSSDGRYIVAGGSDGTIRIWRVAADRKVVHLVHDSFVYSVAFSPDGKYIVSGSSDKTARVWEATTGVEVSRMNYGQIVPSVAFSPDGKYVVSGSGDRTARVWEAMTGVEVAQATHGDYVFSVAFSPDGKYIVSGSSDKTARVWEATTGMEVSRMTHADGVPTVTFSPDGKYVVSGSWDKTALVWEAATGVEVSRVTHDDSVSSVAFSPDGKYVVSGSSDNTARVWEATTGVEVARMTHSGKVNSVAFSPDGKYVVSGSVDKTARVWIWDPQAWIADACSRVSRNLTHGEWKQYLVTMPFSAVCPNLPIEPEVLPTLSPTP